MRIGFSPREAHTVLHHHIILLMYICVPHQRKSPLCNARRKSASPYTITRTLGRNKLRYSHSTITDHNHHMLMLLLFAKHTTISGKTCSSLQNAYAAHSNNKRMYTYTCMRWCWYASHSGGPDELVQVLAYTVTTICWSHTLNTIENRAEHASPFPSLVWYMHFGFRGTTGLARNLPVQFSSVLYGSALRSEFTCAPLRHS